MPIRKYTDADFNGVANIYNQARPDEFYGEAGTFITTPWAEDEYMLSILNTSSLFVYEEDGMLCGFAGFTGARINWLFVDPAHRAKGIGYQLLTYLLDELKDGATLSVWASNQRAQSLYLKLGFEVSRSFYITFQARRLRVNKMLFTPL